MDKKFSLTHTMIVLAMLAGAAGVSTARAQVPTCDALRLYGNAAESGLCRQLTPAGQQHLVCELADHPDIHLTFNDRTALHVTVREQGGNRNCEGNSYLTGMWPASLGIRAGDPNTVCGVGIQQWVDQLNNVGVAQPSGKQTPCTAAFIAAGNTGNISQKQVSDYKQLCGRYRCR